MGAFKNLIRNVALFLFLGGVPSFGWASGLFAPLSFISFFLLLSGTFCLLWLKAQSIAENLKNLLFLRGEAWALWEGEQCIDRSSTFPGETLSSLKNFVKLEFVPEVERVLSRFMKENVPFCLRFQAAGSSSIFSFEGETLEGKRFFFLKNITDLVQQECEQKELLYSKEKILLHLQETLNILPLPIWHRDEHQKIIFCNQSYADTLQTTAEEVCEEGLELTPSRTSIILARKALHTGKSQIFEKEVNAWGEKRYFRIYEIPYDNHKKTIGAAFDISEIEVNRLKTERLIKGREEVLNHLSTAISMYDAEGKLEYYNQAYINLHHFEENFLKEGPFFDEILENLRTRRQLPEHADFLSYKKQQLEYIKEQLLPQEELVHLPDERTLRQASLPHPMGGVLFLSEDITESLILQRKNKALLEGYKTTLDHLNEGLIIIGSDHRIKVFNPCFLRLWNFKDDEIQPDQHFTEVIEKSGDYLYDLSTWQTYKDQFVEIVANRVPHTIQLKQKNGQEIRVKYTPLPNGDHLFSCTTMDFLSHREIF